MSSTTTIPIDLRDIGEWQPTIYAVRDALLEHRVCSPDVTSLCVDPHLAAKFRPTTNEVMLVNEFAHDAVTQGRMMDFGVLPNDVIINTGKRGRNLWLQGALVMPFAGPWIMYHTWELSVAIYIITGADGCTELCELTPVTFGRMKALTIGDRAMIDTREQVEGSDLVVNIAPSLMRYMPGADREFNNFTSPEAAAASNIIDPLMAALAILATRGAECETISANPKLQRARVKSGKKPIPDYDRVNTRSYVTALQLTAKLKRDHQGGTHASPVPHIRQGHFRQYSSGVRSIIADTLVNVKPEAREAFKSTRSHYEVRK